MCTSLCIYIHVCDLHNGLMDGVAMVADRKAIHSPNDVDSRSLRVI